MDGQDWDPVRLGARGGAGRGGHGHGHGRGHASGGAGGGHRSSSAAIAAKLDAADTPMRSKTLSADAVRIILDYRAAHTMSQKELDARCSFPANTMKRLELRTLAPTLDQLHTLNRVLKTGLTLE